MYKLAVLSLKNRALIALITVVVAVFGGLAMTSLKQELIPSVTLPQLVVVTAYPGAAPEVVNNDLSTPIETAIAGVPGLESSSSTSSTNMSIVTAAFTYGTDLATSEQKITQAINRIKSSLPANSDPQVISGGIDDLPIISIAASGGESAQQLADALRAQAIGEIQDIEGVREASLQGAPSQRVSITPDAGKLAAAGTQASAIKTTLEQNGVLLPAGEITQDGKTLSVQSGGDIAGVDDISGLPIVGSDPLRTIGQVATVTLEDNPTTSISRVNGEDAVTISVTKTPAANTVAVSQAVRDLLPAMEKELGSAVTLTLVFDQAPFIEQSIEALATEGLLGLAFAVIVILLFLLDIRATLVTAISIPTSVLITFVGLQVSGYTLNILTLGALTIAIGRVVDDSIVVIENIREHLHALTDTDPRARIGAIGVAVREVAGAITASTVTTVAVFLPLALVGDMVGELFRPFALTVAISLLASLLVSLTIVPVLAYWFLGAKRAPKPTRAKAKAEPAAITATAPVAATAEPMSAEAIIAANAVAAEPLTKSPAEANEPLTETGEIELRRRRARRSAEPVVDELSSPTRLQRAYLPIIDWTLKHSAATLIIAVLVLGGTVALTPFMKTNFLGDTGQNTLSLSQSLEQGASLEAQDAAATTVEKALREIDGVDTVQVSIGSADGSIMSAFGGGGGAQISYSITTDPDADQTALGDRVRAEMKKLKDVGTVTVSAAAGMGGSSNVVLDVTAPGNATLLEATKVVREAVTDLDGAREVTDSIGETRPYVAISVKRDVAAKAGYSEVALGGYVASRMSASQIGTVVIDDTAVKIYLAADNPPATIAEVAAIAVPTPTGMVPLKNLATVEEKAGPASITSESGQRSAAVTLTPASDNIGAVSAEVATAIDGLKLPAGAKVTLGGVSADQADAFSQLGIAMLAAILIVYIVMVATFRSLRQPLLLLISVPFAATGAILLQVITGVPLGVPSLIGVLMLVGIVVTNAIVLVDLVNQFRERGLSVFEAVRHGSARRLRPILMTALATIFALIPMALGITGHGGFISQPLAIVVIGGLVSSTLLTLIVLPSLYNLVEGAKERRAAKRAAVADAA